MVSILCLFQKYNCDCGLFAVIVILYIVGEKFLNIEMFIQQQVSVMKKAMIREFDVVDGKVVFDSKLFKSWFPGICMNYTKEGKPYYNRKTTINQTSPINYNKDGNSLFPPKDIVHLMDEYTLAITMKKHL